MIVKKKLFIALTSEEKEILRKAHIILANFENLATSEQEEDLQALYENFVDDYEHDYALPTAIDLIGAILEKGEVDDEI